MMLEWYSLETGGYLYLGAGHDFARALAQAAAVRACAAAACPATPLPWPFYLIGTRDSFTHELVTKATQVGCCQNINDLMRCGHPGTSGALVPEHFDKLIEAA